MATSSKRRASVGLPHVCVPLAGQQPKPNSLVAGDAQGRRHGLSSRKARRGGCIPSRLLWKCSAATSSRLQAGEHRVGALLRAHGLGRASEERFQGKRLGRQHSSVLAASKQSVNGSPFHGNHHGMGQPQRCLLPHRGIRHLQRCLLPTSLWNYIVVGHQFVRVGVRRARAARVACGH